jgi:hypothetical protein
MKDMEMPAAAGAGEEEEFDFGFGEEAAAEEGGSSLETFSDEDLIEEMKKRGFEVEDVAEESEEETEAMEEETEAEEAY